MTSYKKSKNRLNRQNFSGIRGVCLIQNNENTFCPIKKIFWEKFKIPKGIWERSKIYVGHFKMMYSTLCYNSKFSFKLNDF